MWGDRMDAILLNKLNDISFSADNRLLKFIYFVF